MKTAQKKISKKSSYTVGAPLPDRLPKRALDFMASAVTPNRAFEIAAKVERIAAKNRPAAKAKRVS
jgi:hypothetical protein